MHNTLDHISYNKNKKKIVRVSPMHPDGPVSCDVYHYYTDDNKSLQSLKSVKGITSIHFVDYDDEDDDEVKMAFNEKFWSDKGLHDTINQLALCNGSVLEIAHQSKPSTSFHLMHITSLTIDHDNDWMPSRQMFPNTLIRLVITGKGFNQPLDNMLPDSLQTLNLGKAIRWNHPINASTLPPCLTLLSLGKSFDQTFDGQLPSGITVMLERTMFNRAGLPKSHDLALNLPSHFNQVIDCPTTLRSLSLEAEMPQYLDEVPFIKLKILTLTDLPAAALATITSSRFPVLYEFNLWGIEQARDSISLASLPMSLRRLSINSPVPITSFPIDGVIEKMELYVFCNRDLFRLSKGLIPSSVRKLTLLSYDHVIQEGDLPASLTSLDIKEQTNRDIVFDSSSLPTSIRKLGFPINRYELRALSSILNQMPMSITRICIYLRRAHRLRRLSDNLYFYANNLEQCYIVNKDTMCNIFVL
ncbi:hypothetical protein SAMD00019534_023020 [Acytostelium subglobosum LB1]|uniref:hypothetical protein n=1 Tax=Acytostelium subglobosum LB1 TaxID=1410327 RepID=UPI000644AFCA|nr:hypothetical protein SAMD00019534_023020 [Acytostelium subglobosum LB1]GAM19127.1 hypothetical protein SAMD00019534_023020 [Acytostelium subglobosum LB1]|eukprot:XP_012757054.1 hypothetical protein SAMD00019534_023020 [Acytostelium subglobosum LB1]